MSQHPHAIPTIAEAYAKQLVLTDDEHKYVQAKLEEVLRFLMKRAQHPMQVIGFVLGYSLGVLAGYLGLSWDDERLVLMTMRIGAHALEEKNTGKLWEP